MSYFLGIDGGGTQNGLRASRCARPSSSPRTGRPIESSARRIYRSAWFSVSGTADTVLARQSLKATDIRGICGGFGGAARPAVAKRMSIFLERSFPKAEVQSNHRHRDRARSRGRKGRGRRADRRHRLGSLRAQRGREDRPRRRLGPVAGRSKAAPSISAAARLPPSAAMRTAWGRPQNLSDRIFKSLDARNWGTLVEHIAKNPDEVFPRVYPLVARAAEQGDEVSRKILDSAADALVELADHVIRKLGWPEKISAWFAPEAFSAIAPTSIRSSMRASPRLRTAHDRPAANFTGRSCRATWLGRRQAAPPMPTDRPSTTSPSREKPPRKTRDAGAREGRRRISSR